MIAIVGELHREESSRLQVRSWRSLRLQPKIAFRCFSLVHWADLQSRSRQWCRSKRWLSRQFGVIQYQGRRARRRNVTAKWTSRLKASRTSPDCDHGYRQSGFFSQSTGIRNPRHWSDARQYVRVLRRGNYYFKGNSGGRVGWNCVRQGVTSLASHASALRLISSGK
jgi:hypothetical protein